MQSTIVENTFCGSLENIENQPQQQQQLSCWFCSIQKQGLSLKKKKKAVRRLFLPEFKTHSLRPGTNFILLPAVYEGAIPSLRNSDAPEIKISKIFRGGGGWGKNQWWQINAHRNFMNFEPIQEWWLEWEWMEGWRRLLALGQRQKATLLQTIAPFHILFHWHKLHFESISITRGLKNKKVPPLPNTTLLPLSNLLFYLLFYIDVCIPLTFHYHQQNHALYLTSQTILNEIRLIISCLN